MGRHPSPSPFDRSASGPASSAGASPALDVDKLECMFTALMGNHDLPQTQAEQLLWAAHEADDPCVRVQLAQQALDLNPHCPNAYVFLAAQCRHPQKALEYYRSACQVCQENLGEQFHTHKGAFWQHGEKRPYMRGLHGQARSLIQMHQFQDAANILTQMLHYNINDNQGARAELLYCWMHLQKYREIIDLLDRQFPDDWLIESVYTRILVEYILDNPRSPLTHTLALAVKRNPFVPSLLLRTGDLPARSRTDGIEVGGQDEAISYAELFLPFWRKTPGLTDWLQRNMNFADASFCQDKPSSAKSLISKKLTQQKCSTQKLQKLPKSHDVWVCEMHPLEENEQTGQENWLILLTKDQTDEILNYQIMGRYPSVCDRWNFYSSTMQAPKIGSACRPTRLILLDDQENRQLACEWAEALEIQCQLEDHLPMSDALDALLDSLEN